jgi:hypothetical protein
MNIIRQTEAAAKIGVKLTKENYTMQDALNILKAFPEVAKSLVGSINENPNVFRNLFVIKGRTVPALDTNQLILTLEATDGLSELTSALLTGKGEVGIIVNKITSVCHAHDVTTQATHQRAFS